MYLFGRKPVEVIKLEAAESSGLVSSRPEEHLCRDIRQSVTAGASGQLLGSIPAGPQATPSAMKDGAFYADEINLIIGEKTRRAEESYRRAVAEGREENFSDLEELRFWEEQGRDLERCRIVRIVGKYLPATVVDSDRLRRFLYRKVHDLIAAEEDFSVVYIHTGVSGAENSPGLRWLRRQYETLPQVGKQRLRAVYALHPAIGMRFSLWAMGSWLSDGLYDKITFVSRVEFLWDYLKPAQVEIPDFVTEHDKELETRPLMDYGIEVDPLQAHQSLPHASLGHRVPYQ